MTTESKEAASLLENLEQRAVSLVLEFQDDPRNSQLDGNDDYTVKLLRKAAATIALLREKAELLASAVVAYRQAEEALFEVPDAAAKDAQLQVIHKLGVGVDSALIAYDCAKEKGAM